MSSKRKLNIALATQIRETLGDELNIEIPVANAVKAIALMPRSLASIIQGTVYTNINSALYSVAHTWLMDEAGLIVDITPLSMDLMTEITYEVGGSVSRLKPGERIYDTQVYTARHNVCYYEAVMLQEEQEMLNLYKMTQKESA